MPRNANKLSSNQETPTAPSLLRKNPLESAHLILNVHLAQKPLFDPEQQSPTAFSGPQKREALKHMPLLAWSPQRDRQAINGFKLHNRSGLVESLNLDNSHKKLKIRRGN